MIGSSMAAGFPGGGVACVMVSGVLDVAVGGGAESLWRLRGESISKSSRGLVLAMLGKRDTTRDPWNCRIQYEEGWSKGGEREGSKVTQQVRSFPCHGENQKRELELL